MKYGGNELHYFAQEREIDLRVTTPHSSEQNGRVEISNYIVCTMARKLLLYGKLAKGLWLEAVDTAVYILNLMLSQALDGKNPYEVVATQAN